MKKKIANITVTICMIYMFFTGFISGCIFCLNTLKKESNEKEKTV